MELKQAIEILKDYVETNRLMRDLTTVNIINHDKSFEDRNKAIETIIKEIEKYDLYA